MSGGQALYRYAAMRLCGAAVERRWCGRVWAGGVCCNTGECEPVAGGEGWCVTGGLVGDGG